MIALLAASAALSTPALSFAPPLDRPLRYETTERRFRGDGQVQDATLIQSVVFSADGDGFVMTIRTTGYRTALPPAQSGPFDAVMKPMVGNTIRVRLSPGGVPLRVIDGAAYWSAMLASLRVQVAAHLPHDPAIAPARTMLAALEATPAEARDARLIANTDDLLGTHLPPIAVGAHVPEEHGTIGREADTGGAARYRERETRDAGGRTLRIDADIAVSRRTGLVTHSVRRTAVADGAHELMLSETEIALIS